MKLAAIAAVLALSSVASAERSRGQTFVPKGRSLNPQPEPEPPLPPPPEGEGVGGLGALVGVPVAAYVLVMFYKGKVSDCPGGCQSAREDTSDRRLADRRRVQREAALEPRSFLSAVRPKWSRVKQVSVVPDVGADHVQTGLRLRW